MLKTPLRLLICLTLLASCCSGCAPGIHFITGNDVYKEKVVLWLNDKSKISGQITVAMEMNISMPVVTYPSYIDFIPEGSTQSKRINLSDITGYTYGTDFYALKQVDIALDGTSRLLFLKRLTGENSRLQLYELLESGRSRPTGEPQLTYFLSLPSSAPLETINTRSSSLVPNFDIKMSSLLVDCPPLADKILAKDKGYFIPQIAIGTKKQPEVLLRIINEYDSCR